MDNSKITIRLDLDDVLNDLTLYWMELHYERTGEKINLKSWDVHEQSKYGEKIYDYFNEENFFYNIPVKEGAKRLIRFLDENSFMFDYNIISSCSRETATEFEYISEQKYFWLRDNLGEYSAQKFTLVGNDKSKFSADMIVDDSVDNLINQGNGHCVKVLFSAPHNINFNTNELSEEYDEHFVRIDTHTELLELIKEIMSQGSVKNYLNNKMTF